MSCIHWELGLDGKSGEAAKHKETESRELEEGSMHRVLEWYVIRVTLCTRKKRKRHFQSYKGYMKGTGYKNFEHGKATNHKHFELMAARKTLTWLLSRCPWLPGCILVRKVTRKDAEARKEGI